MIVQAFVVLGSNNGLGLDLIMRLSAWVYQDWI